ncbi:hypothetical protein yc1106_08976 [Curvularia clavata]|uniref:Heterokaryon incompatibility domain-containing protein n=1 Tax=Curvularia clavata TaxID=95742 RepID=A0A9Q8ZE96_CURCL|nr:hypothetical protein yc1106_08976 [Curvularia clavata]
MSTVRFSSHSCEECEKIVIDGTGPPFGQCSYFPHGEVQELSQSCDLFKWALKSSDEPLYESNKLRFSISDACEDLKYLNVEWMDEENEPVSEFATNPQLHIFSEEDDPAAKYIKARPLALSPGISDDPGWCLKLYKDCLKHKACKAFMEKNRNNIAPARLLDVRSNSQLRLYTVPQGEHPLYAALSYCWGRSQQQQDTKTTIANVRDRRGGIDIRQLPQSIIDAVEVTRRLELSYLWVDALCILQDHEIDRKSEMSKMASIYRGATITISAASADDSTEGFLRNYNPRKAYGSLFRLPYHNKHAGGVVKGSVFLSERPVADMYQENIDRRAWTMQEDMLSLRLLRFGSGKTTWRCPTYPNAKKIYGGDVPGVNNKDPNFCVSSPYRIAQVRSNISAFGPWGSQEDWLRAIREYTLRELSNPNDRLPACAALAENFAAVMDFTSSDYLAGLWKNNIHMHLLWHRLEGKKAESIFNPTWSWASIDGPIGFLGFALSEPTPGAKNAKYVSSSMKYEFDNHKYSGVIEGSLRLNGRWKYAYWDSYFLRRSSDDADVLPLTIYWDENDGNSSDVPKSRMMCCFEVSGSNHDSLGLVLIGDESTGFRRAGCFKHIQNAMSVIRSFFDETEPRDIVIY